MGFLDRLLGRTPQDDGVPRRTATYDGHESPVYGTPPPTPTGPGRSEDDVAIDRYRYLLRTAPPEAVEQAHAEAFARLTPEQRRRVLTDLGESLPPAERATSDDPQSLARMATRAEMRNPGTLERSFGGRQGANGQGGPGMGSMIGSSMLGTIAGVVIGSAVANMMFGPMFGDPTANLAGDGGTGGEGDPGATEADPGAGDTGGEFTEAGGDFGGFGDFGGGDFGGFGDF